MATCELRGTLKGRDGQSSLFTVKIENNLKSMITGVRKLNADISDVLTDLVLKERGNEKGDIQPNDEEDEEDSDGENNEPQKTFKILPSSQEPPTKRMRTLRP
ncbi:hypothetical protein ACEWY4_021828 [Coilia grayii]|uniref:Uncharacterized protein n=1 Tax=Coilia grayii TaxID=363190 RepID=A0ABD1J498_9TELE